MRRWLGLISHFLRLLVPLLDQTQPRNCTAFSPIGEVGEPKPLCPPLSLLLRTLPFIWYMNIRIRVELFHLFSAALVRQESRLKKRREIRIPNWTGQLTNSVSHSLFQRLPSWMESPDLCKSKSVTYKKSIRSSYEVGWPCIDTAFSVLESGKCLPLELQQIFIPEQALLSVGAV